MFLPGEFHGQRSLAGYSSWGGKELDTTEWLTHTQWWSPDSIPEREREVPGPLATCCSERQPTLPTASLQSSHLVALFREELGCLRLPRAQRRQAMVSCQALDTLKQPWKTGKNTLGRLHPLDSAFARASTHHPSLTVLVLRGISSAPQGPLWTQGSLSWWSHVSVKHLFNPRASCQPREGRVDRTSNWRRKRTMGSKHPVCVLEGSSL